MSIVLPPRSIETMNASTKFQQRQQLTSSTSFVARNSSVYSIVGMPAIGISACDECQQQQQQLVR